MIGARTITIPRFNAVVHDIPVTEDAGDDEDIYDDEYLDDDE